MAPLMSLWLASICLFLYPKLYEFQIVYLEFTLDKRIINYSLSISCNPDLPIYLGRWFNDGISLSKALKRSPPNISSSNKSDIYTNMCMSCVLHREQIST